MEIYTFDKSLQERLVDYEGILSSRETIVPASQIKIEWSYHIELVIEPIGWQALWKIPRLTCQDFEIHYPTIVVVQIEQVYFNELSALVKIIAVQDEIHLPEKCDVPLIELYPTKEQENDALDLIGTAICIDQLRFFYNHLWMPWDADDDDNVDWVGSHLETRIRLFFDMKRGVVNKDTSDVIRTLMREGREINAKITRLEEDMSDEEEDTKCLVDEGKACQLMKLHFRMQQIKNEMDVLENPAMRDMLVRNPSGIDSKEVKRRESRGRKLEAYFVWQGGSLDDTIDCLNKAKKFLPNDVFIKTTGCMQEALLGSDVGDRIIVGEGEHQVRGAGGLEEGGAIVGIGNHENTILCAKETAGGPSVLDFSGDEVLLENLSLDLGELQAGILVRKGLVKIIGCKIFASNQSVVKLGIVVLPESTISLQSTSFVGLGTAVVVHNGGDCRMENCHFRDCIEGIQLQDGVKFQGINSKFSGFKEYAIRMETEKYLTGTENKTGGTELLVNVAEVSLEECEFTNNKRGDVAMRPRSSVALSAKQDNAMEIVP